MVDRTADVSPVKSHFPFAELQGLTARQSAFQRTHPRVRQYILDGLRGNDGVSYQDWQALARIHHVQSQVDRLRAQQGRPSPYKPVSQPQPWHNPMDETAVIRPPHRRAFRMAAAKTPGQQAADDFLNSSEYWNLVDQGTHPEHRDTEDEFPDYEEDYDVYPGHDEAGPSHDRAADRSWEDEPEENESEDSAYQREGRPGIEHLLNRLEDTSPQDDEERYLHEQLRQDGFTFARNGEFRKTDEHGNWHTIMLPGDYRRARTMTTEFYNPHTEETITHTGHDNVDSLLDRYDINHSYSKASAAGPVHYPTHFHNWVRANPQTYTAQKYRSLRMASVAGLSVKEYEGEEGNANHITRSERGMIPIDWVRAMPGARGERPGEHRNRQGVQWEEFKNALRTAGDGGIHAPLFITVDHGSYPKLAEGNHRRDAYVELGATHVPAEIRYFGHAERQGTVGERVMRRTAVERFDGELPAEEFAERFKPTEYGEDWPDVADYASRENPPYEPDMLGDDPVDVTRDGWVEDGHHRVIRALDRGTPVRYRWTERRHDPEYYASVKTAAVKSKPIFDAEIGGPSGKLQKLMDNMTEVDPDPHLSPLYGDAKWHKDYELLVGGKHGFRGGYQAELDDNGGVSYHKGGVWTNHMGKSIPVAHVIKPVLGANKDKMVASDPDQEVQYFAVSSIPGDEGQVYRTLHDAAARPVSLANRWDHPGRGHSPRALSEGFMNNQGGKRTAAHDDDDFDPDFEVNVDPESLEALQSINDRLSDAVRDKETVEDLFRNHGEDYEERNRRMDEEARRELDKPEFPGAQWRKPYPNTAVDIPGYGLGGHPGDTGWENWQIRKNRIQEAKPVIGEDAETIGHELGVPKRSLSAVEEGDTQHGLGRGHTAPASGPTFDAPEDYLPDVYEHPEYYVSPRDRRDPLVHQSGMENWRALKAARGNPDALVKIYRAVPHGVGVIEGNTNPAGASWVSASPSYARRHADAESCPSCGGDMQVISGVARAGDLHNEGYLEEWGYTGDPIRDHSALTECPPGAFEVRKAKEAEFMKRQASVDESGIKAAGIAVIAMDTGRVLMQQRALNPLTCPCGLGVTWDESNGYQHDDGSVSHDGEFYGQSVSDLLDQGHPIEKTAMSNDEGKTVGYCGNRFCGSPILDSEIDQHGVGRCWSCGQEITPEDIVLDQNDVPKSDSASWFEKEAGENNEPGKPSYSLQEALLGMDADDEFLRPEQTEQWPEVVGDQDFGTFRIQPSRVNIWGPIEKKSALEFDPNEGTWEFPGGKLDEGESPRQAAIREFREEVGQDLPPGVFVGAWVSPGGLVVSAGAIPPPNEDAERELLWQRSEPAFERSREGDPMRGTHPEPDVSYQDFRVPNPGEPWIEGFHNLDLLDEPPHMNPFGGLEKLNASGPVYKGFIYLIQNERDIDLGQREIANPDDPDGDMSEQSAWWDIEHAKENPALRSEVKAGTPWDELELWADKSVRSNKEIKEAFAKFAMPTTQSEPVVRGIEDSGENSYNDWVELPSGEWLRKRPWAEALHGTGDFEDDKLDQDDADYYKQQAGQRADIEEFASRLGRALSDPEDEPLVPEAVRGNKASDPTPAVYIRKYPQFHDMRTSAKDTESFKHSTRGKQIGYLHSVLGDGDKAGYHNIGLIGDAGENGSNLQHLPMVSIDHTHSSLPEYAEALAGGDPDQISRMKFFHQYTEISPFERHFLGINKNNKVARKTSNPLAPGDTERAIGAAETLRPWAHQRGLEPWLDAAQDRMSMLGKYATGTESLFPYRMAHEELEQHVAAKRRPSLNGFQKIRDMIASGRPDLTIKPAGDMHYSEHDKIMGSTYPEWNDDPGEPDFDRPQVYALQTGAHVSFLAPVIHNETGEHGWIRGSSKIPPENWKIYAHDQLNHAIKGTNPNRRVPQPAEERYVRGRASGKPPASAKPARQEFEGEVPLDERGHQIVGEPRRDPWHDLGLERGFADEAEHGWKYLNYLEPEDVRHHNPEESVEHKNPEDALPWWAVS